MNELLLVTLLIAPLTTFAAVEKGFHGCSESNTILSSKIIGDDGDVDKSKEAFELCKIRDNVFTLKLGTIGNPKVSFNFTAPDKAGSVKSKTHSAFKLVVVNKQDNLAYVVKYGAEYFDGYVDVKVKKAGRTETVATYSLDEPYKKNYLSSFLTSYPSRPGSALYNDYLK